MIEISHLSISYSNESILDDVSFSLPRYGLICICGESGSGKTSLLNAISSLIPFRGSIKIDGLEVNNLNEKEGADFRLRNIGFVFQDFKLFMNQTVQENVEFPLKVLSNGNSKMISRRSNDLLRFCRLDDKKDRRCNFLSGGEKQRVAIARALINSPKILVCDEPTGSLDESTGIEIMDLIKSYSKRALVLVVTHDKDLAKSYGDVLVQIKNKKVEIKNEIINKNDKDFVSFQAAKRNNIKTHIPVKFTLSHANQNMKQKKIRSIISTFFMSIGLLGIGLSIAFSNSISNDIKRSYSSLIQSSSITVEKKNEFNEDYKSLSLEDTKELVEKYNDKFVLQYGVAYKANFEDFFKDTNAFYIYSENSGLYLNNFSIRDFNDFLLINDIPNEILPYKADYINDDEIILGLTINEIRQVCSTFGIEPTVNSLSDYFLANEIKLTVELENSDWDYWDEQVFSVVGFSLSTETFIAHSNRLFNKIMFEDNMRFPTTDDEELNTYPWVLEKITYIKTNNRYDFIMALRENDDLEKYAFELCENSFFEKKLSGIDLKDNQYLIPYYYPGNAITRKELEYIKSVDSNLQNPILYNNGAYVNYPSSLISGFANKCYFSFSEDDLLQTIEDNASVELNKNEKEVLKDSVILSDFSKSFENHVSFSSNNQDLLTGRNAENLNEIVVSNKFIEDFNLTNSNYLFVAVTTKEIDKNRGVFIREYQTAKLRIVGIKNSDDYKIYHNEFWTEDFFKLSIGLKIQQTSISSVSFSLNDENKSNSIVAKLKRAFPQYNIINPLSSINESVDSLCKSISIFILIVSLFSLIISLILLISCTYLHVQDINKEIALARCIGINSKDSLMFLYSFMFCSLGISFLISFFELTFLSLLISYMSSSILCLPFEFSINGFAYVAMFFGTVLIGLISISSTSKHIKKIKPIDCLKI